MAKKSNITFLNKKILVFCEGQTEYHYYDSYRTNNNFSFIFKPVDVHGGGYSKMLGEVKKSGPSGTLARVILLDFDRYLKHQTERKVFADICEYVMSQNSRGAPIIFIVSNPDFDEFILLHNAAYKGNRNSVLKSMGYSGINDLKSDKNIYCKFNKGKTLSVQNALIRLNKKTILSNLLHYLKSKFELSSKLLINLSCSNIKTSNIADLYTLIDLIAK